MSKNHAYIRVSNDTLNLENQKSEIETALPDAVIEYHCEIASGSLRAAKRPVLTQLISTLQSGDTLILTELSRLGRDAMDTIHMVSGLELRDVKIVTIRQAESKDAFQSMLMTMLNAFAAQKELETNRQRTKAALALRKAQGVVLGKPKGTNKLKGNPQAKRTIETMLRKSYSKADILRELNLIVPVSMGTLERYLKQ